MKVFNEFLVLFPEGEQFPFSFENNNPEYHEDIAAGERKGIISVSSCDVLTYVPYPIHFLYNISLKDFIRSLEKFGCHISIDNEEMITLLRECNLKNFEDPVTEMSFKFLRALAAKINRISLEDHDGSETVEFVDIVCLYGKEWYDDEGQAFVDGFWWTLEKMIPKYSSIFKKAQISFEQAEGGSVHILVYSFELTTGIGGLI